MTYYIVGKTTLTLKKKDILIEGNSSKNAKEVLPTSIATEVLDHFLHLFYTFYSSEETIYHSQNKDYSAILGERRIYCKYDGFNSYIYMNYDSMKVPGSNTTKDEFASNLKGAVEFFKRLFS